MIWRIALVATGVAALAYLGGVLISGPADPTPVDTISLELPKPDDRDGGNDRNSGNDRGDDEDRDEADDQDDD